MRTKVCTPLRYAQAGEACDGAVNRCESGDCNTTTGVCPVVMATGAACFPANPSDACAVEGSCFKGTCQIPDPATCK